METTLEVGAVNEVKPSYKAMITGIENNCGGDDYFACKLELWIEETMEVSWKIFTFSFNLNNCCSWKEPGPDYLDDSNSRDLCRLLGLDPDYMLNRLVYGKRKHADDYHSIRELDEELFIGKEIGVLLGDGYFHQGLHRIEAFIPLSDLSTMPIPD